MVLWVPTEAVWERRTTGSSMTESKRRLVCRDCTTSRPGRSDTRRCRVFSWRHRGRELESGCYSWSRGAVHSMKTDTQDIGFSGRHAEPQIHGGTAACAVRRRQQLEEDVLAGPRQIGHED